MKRTLILTLTLMLILTLFVGAHAETITTDLIPLVKNQGEEYMFTMNEDCSLHVLAKKQDYSGDAYADSYHILGRNVADFTLEFDYTSAAVWQQDRISFRCQTDENEWNQYMILFKGLELGEGQRGISIIKGEDRDHPFAYEEMWLDPGVQFFCKLVVEGHKITLYFDENPEFPFGPLFEVELPEGKTSEETAYRDDYLAAGDFQIVSWGGDFTMTYFNLIEEKAE